MKRACLKLEVLCFLFNVAVRVSILSLSKMYMCTSDMHVHE